MSAKLEDWIEMEHRWGHRMPRRIDVMLLRQGRIIGRGVLDDLSISGGFVRTKADVPTLSRVSLKPTGLAFTACDGDGLEAWVVRRGDRGIGVEFCELAAAAVCRLMAFTCRQARGTRSSYNRRRGQALRRLHVCRMKHSLDPCAAPHAIAHTKVLLEPIAR